MQTAQATAARPAVSGEARSLVIDMRIAPQGFVRSDLTATPAIATARGLERAIWSAILERDIDLMLVDLLHTSAAFRAWLLGRVADDLPDVDPVAGFLGAFHSVTTPNGESDIEAEWQLADGGRLVVLLEDK